MALSAKLDKFIDNLRTSYWFVPSVMIVVAILFAGFTVDFDAKHDLQWFWLFQGDASASRELLSMIAGSMATVGGVTFSITMVVLSLAASQLGPRLLRSFMRDRIVHVVLGAFFATFAYCLIVLRSIHSGENGGAEFTPNLSVTLASLFTLVSLGLFILFLHHIARAIQAPRLIAKVGHDLNQIIVSLYGPSQGVPGQAEDGSDRLQTSLPYDFIAGALPVCASEGCYVQAIEYESLLEVADEYDLVVVLDTRPGDFVLRGHPLAYVRPGAKVSGKIRQKVEGAFALGGERTLIQDVRFGIAQLVEVAAIALSPGVNEPFTAISCIHRLSDSLALLASREAPSPYRFGKNSRQLRLVCMQTSFDELMDEGFSVIRSMAAGNNLVLTQLMAALAALAAEVRRGHDKQAVKTHASKVLALANRTLPEEEDLEPLKLQYSLVLERLRVGGFIHPFRTAQSPPEKSSPPPPPPPH